MIIIITGFKGNNKQRGSRSTWQLENIHSSFLQALSSHFNANSYDCINVITQNAQGLTPIQKVLRLKFCDRRFLSETFIIN